MLQINSKLILVFVTVSFVINLVHFCSELDCTFKMSDLVFIYVVSSGSPKYSRVHAEIF
jgi:hypothetical protein